MRGKLLTLIARIAERRPGLVFIGALLVTAMSVGLASQLTLTTHFKDMLPQGHPVVEEFNRILDDYSTASMIIVGAKGKEAQLKQFADELTPRIKALTEFIKRVDYKLERGFIQEHAFMLQKEKDLKNSKDIFKDLSLVPWLTHFNDNFEKTYVYDTESISTKEKENTAVMFLDNLKYWITTIEHYASEGQSLEPRVAETAAERFLFGDEYMISQDKDMLLLFAQPTFSLNEVDKTVTAVNAVDEVIAEVAKGYPGIFAGITGSMAIQRDEMVAVSQDMYLTSLVAMAFIIVLFIVSFRMWVAPILAGICLIMGIAWTAGFSFLAVGSLNLMTSMFSVILIGLGVDFSIHIISVYTEHRAAGYPIGDALQQALLKSGNGIITGALTTACAFLTLTVSESTGMSEFGIVAGSGVIFCMLAAILVLPSMLSLRDKVLEKRRKGKFRIKAPEFAFLGSLGEAISRKPILSLVCTLILTALLTYSALQISFDYNYLNMEPKGLRSIKLQYEMEDEFDVTPDFALVTASSVEEARRISEEAKELKMIGMVTSISEYVPSGEEQKRRLPYINEIRESLMTHPRVSVLSDEELGQFIDELHRLEDNVIELAQLAYLGGQDKVDAKTKELIGDLDNPNNRTMIASLVEKLRANPRDAVENLNTFNALFEPRFRQIALKMASTAPVSVEMLPKNIADRFVNIDRNRYLVTIYPKQTVWDHVFLERFTTQMQKLDPRVTGIPPISYVYIEMMIRDGRVAAMLTLVVVFLLLLWDFRKFRFAVLAMTPLVVGVLWMIGTMHLIGLQLTMASFMGIPLIIGIGIDDGVHILHRYKIEGAGKIRTVFSSTGKAVMLTSITTMLAFGSLSFATHRGLGSLGIVLFIGVGTCFLTSVLILPALLGWMEKKNAKQSIGHREAEAITGSETRP
jgi:hopanoid biosynthesis associated RND transporter like protein HpnN